MSQSPFDERLDSWPLLDPSAMEAGSWQAGKTVEMTLLVSDLVGSTRLFSDLGDRRAADLFWRHDRMARDLLAGFGGREIDKSDGFLLLFERSSDAVSYALAYHQALERMSTAEEVELRSRVGIHRGAVILHENPPADVARGAKPIEVEGLAKPMAARLMSLARGRQTLLTRGAFDAARRAEAGAVAENELRWLHHGLYALQGIDEEVEIFEVGLAGLTPLVSPEDSEKVRRIEVGKSWKERLRLLRWHLPDLPERPFPLLLPYSHPRLLAGRERELAELERLLDLPLTVVGLCATSGAGKSSLLWGGLVPDLRERGRPVAFNRHPHEPELARRLLGDLIDPDADALHLAEGDAAAFVERLVAIEQAAGQAPILVLDQIEPLLRQAEYTRARAVLGMLLAATAQRRPGTSAPPCRWLLAYRQEYHGEMIAWLRDVLADARTTSLPRLDGLPHDLSLPERFQAFALEPLGTPPPGGNALAETTRVLQAVIERPLTLRRGGEPFYPFRFVPGAAERLARAFAEARLARPDAPLTPELQVVLCHLLDTAEHESSADAGAVHVIDIPENPGALIDEALEAHVERALTDVFPAGVDGTDQWRARALLALRELAEVTGERRGGMPAEALVRAIGPTGHEILEKLATPAARLVVSRQHADGRRYLLSHDRLAEVVVRMVEKQGRRGKLLIDSELLELRRFVNLSSALYKSRASESTHLPGRRFRRIAAHSEALLWSEEHREWWVACRRRRRADLARRGAWSCGIALILILVVAGVWQWAAHRAELQQLYEQVARGRPETALASFMKLTARPDASEQEMLRRLEQRRNPLDLLEKGLGGVSANERGAVILALADFVRPMVAAAAEKPEELRFIAILAWALDFFPGRDPAHAEAARKTRREVLERLRRQYPPPRLAEEIEEWAEIPAGHLPGRTPSENLRLSGFRMLVHEVTNADFRRLVPQHPGADRLPAIWVDWYQAYAYAAWLGGRLPTEMEWLYAARAGCRHVYCRADGNAAILDEVAWYRDNATDPETHKPAPQPVALRSPNPWGLYDLYGNVYEWNVDWYKKESVDYRGPDPVGVLAGELRVMRGGGCWDEASRILEDRQAWSPGDSNSDLGFRVVIPVVTTN